MSNIHAGEGLFENDLFTRGGKFTILLPRVKTLLIHPFPPALDIGH